MARQFLRYVTCSRRGNNRIKILFNIDKALQDHVPVDHPTLGTFPILLVYERLNRICLFCGIAGHDHAECPDKIRMIRLKADPRFKDRSDVQALTELKIQPWINNSAILPNQLALTTTAEPPPHENPTPTHNQEFVDTVDLNSQLPRIYSLKRQTGTDGLGENPSARPLRTTSSQAVGFAEPPELVRATKKRLLEARHESPPTPQ